jgi:hypothetical protein
VQTFCLENLSPVMLKTSSVKLAAINGSPIVVDGEVYFKFEAYDMCFSGKFVVSSYVDEIILGLPWIHDTDCTLNCKRAEATICGRQVQLKCRTKSLLNRSVLLAETLCVRPRECAAASVYMTRTSLRGGEANFLLEPKMVNSQAITARALMSNGPLAMVRILNPSDTKVKSGWRVYADNGRPWAHSQHESVNGSIGQPGDDAVITGLLQLLQGQQLVPLEVGTDGTAGKTAVEHGSGANLLARASTTDGSEGRDQLLEAGGGRDSSGDRPRAAYVNAETLT